MGRYLITGLMVIGLLNCSDPDIAPGELPLRQLTPDEYNNTIRDLFGYPNNQAWLDQDPTY